MSELLIRVVDKVNTDDIVKHCQLTKRGDVIVVCEDGWNWSPDELSNPDWRILKIPVLSVSEAQALLTPERPADPQDLRRTLLRRKFKLDIDNVGLPNGVKNFIADDTRAQPFLLVPLNIAQIRALKLAKAPVPDPLFP